MTPRNDQPPGRFKAMIAGGLAGWLGKTIRLTDGGFWSQWFGSSNFTGKYPLRSNNCARAEVSE